MDKNMCLTKEQEEVFEKAIELLGPYDTEEMSHLRTYFEYKGEEMGNEHDVCDSDKCEKKSKKNIRSILGKYKRIEARFIHNNGDHEDIERCSVCGKPFNQWLTWVKDPFEHHEEYSRTKNDFILPSTAFELVAIFQSMPSHDHEIRYWSMVNDYENSKKKQDEFLNRVLAYAQLVIDTLTEKE